jgi:hypothetical protein
MRDGDVLRVVAGEEVYMDRRLVGHVQTPGTA